MNYEPSNEFESSGSMTPHSSGSNSSNPKKASASPRAASGSNAASDERTQCQCSYCGTKVFREESKSMPFCSNRCKQIDLGKWLNESYRLPYEGESSRKQYETLEEDE